MSGPMRAGGSTGDLRQVQRAHDQLRAEVARALERLRELEKSGVRVTVSSSAPSSPNPGDLWIQP